MVRRAIGKWCGFALLAVPFAVLMWSLHLAAQTVQSGNPNPTPVGIVSSNVAVCDPYNPMNCLTPSATTIANSTGSSGGAATATMAAVVGKTNYLCSIDIESVGAAGSVSPITVTGLLGGTITYQGFVAVAAGSSFLRTYSPCLSASAANVAIVVTTTALASATDEIIASGFTH